MKIKNIFEYKYKTIYYEILTLKIYHFF